MKKTKSKFSKKVELTLPPGDVGLLGPYQPYSPPKRNLAAWRKVRFSMTETNFEHTTLDEETQLINAWILQLVQRELTYDLEAAEHKLKRPLEIRVDALAAEVIQTALALRFPKPKPGKKSK